MLEPLETSNVAKYHIGKRVEGIGEAGDVSGTVVSVVPLAPGAVAGPGRLMVRLDGGHVLEEQQQQHHQQQQQQQLTQSRTSSLLSSSKNCTFGRA